MSNSITNQEPKPLDYKAKELEIKDGVRSQEAIVNQSPKGNVVNTITVNEVKEFDKKNDSKQDVDVEELKKEVAKKATIHEFAEGTVLTDKILSEVKSGDIVKVANMEFVANNKVNQSPRSISGKMLGAVTASSITVISLDWVKGEELEPTMTTLTIPTEPVETAEEQE